MSGSINWVQVPDFAGNMLEAQNAAQQRSMNALRLQQAKTEFGQREQYDNALRANVAGLMSDDPAQYRAALSSIAQSGPMALRDMMQLMRLEREGQMDQQMLARLGFGGAAAPAPAASVAPAPAAGPAVPAQAPGPELDRRALNARFAAARNAIMNNPNLTPEQQAQELAKISEAAAREGAGLPANVSYPNPGATGFAAGLPAANGAVPPIMPAGNPRTGQSSAGPTLQQIQAGLASGRERVRHAAQGALEIWKLNNPEWQLSRRGGMVYAFNPRTREEQPIGPEHIVQRTSVPNPAGGPAIPGERLNGGEFRPDPDRPELGNSEQARAGATASRLAQKIIDGSASPDEINQFQMAMDQYTAQTTRPDGSIVPGRGLTPLLQRAANALQRPAAPAPAPAQPANQQANAPTGQAAPAAAAPPGPQPRTETSQWGTTRTTTPPQLTQKAIDDERTLRADVDNMATAIRQYREALNDPELNLSSPFNPRSAAGGRLVGAFENLMVALRGQGFLNTGVLQPGEDRNIRANILVDPRTWQGSVTSRERIEAQLNQFVQGMEQKVDGARRSLGFESLPPNYFAATPRPGGGQPAPGASAPNPLNLRLPGS